MIGILSQLVEKVAEYLFIGLMVVTLPIWFPPLALYVIIDPLYHLHRWLNRLRMSHAAESRMETRYVAPEKRVKVEGMMVLSAESS